MDERKNEPWPPSNIFPEARGLRANTYIPTREEENVEVRKKKKRAWVFTNSFVYKFYGFYAGRMVRV